MAESVSSASGRPPPGASPVRFVVAGSAGDPRGDAGDAAPAYADLTRALIEDGNGRARITVSVAGVIPQILPEGEVAGVGVDLFARSSEESDYQLFADGSADGWTPYLHGPKGVAPLPGSFDIQERRLAFVLEWRFLGGLKRGRFSAFADWSRTGPLRNSASEDHAPDSGTSPFYR